MKSGLTITFERSPTIANPVPMPSNAVKIGRPIASTDPNASSRMTTAATSPITSDDPPKLGNRNMRPPSSNVAPPISFPGSAISMMRLAVSSETWPARLSNWISPYAIFPPGATWRAPAGE